MGQSFGDPGRSLAGGRIDARVRRRGGSRSHSHLNGNGLTRVAHQRLMALMVRVRAGVLSLALLSMWPGIAWAQRGGDYEARREVQGADGPSRGFPGLFNTELVEPGAVTVSAPLLNSYVGISPDLTLGTNVLYGLPWIGLNPSFLAVGRFRAHSTLTTRTTVDALAGGFYARSGDGNEYATNHVMAFGSNTLFVATPSHHFTFNFLAGSFGLSYRDEAAPELYELRLSGVVAGVTHTYNATNWLAFSTMVLPLSFLTGRIGEVASVEELDAAEVGLRKFPWRVHATLAGGRWLFELGALGIARSVLPWVSASARFGGS